MSESTCLWRGECTQGCHRSSLAQILYWSTTSQKTSPEANPNACQGSGKWTCRHWTGWARFSRPFHSLAECKLRPCQLSIPITLCGPSNQSSRGFLAGSWMLLRVPSQQLPPTTAISSPWGPPSRTGGTPWTGAPLWTAGSTRSVERLPWRRQHFWRRK